jgi:hypothetical protein
MDIILTFVALVSPLVLTPCEYEDSNGCYWDAGQSGNGVGHSFTALDDGTVIYWPEGF